MNKVKISIFYSNNVVVFHHRLFEILNLEFQNVPMFLHPRYCVDGLIEIDVEAVDKNKE